jgi:hypothetical protein
MREAGLENADEAFDSILNFNWTRCLNLLAVLEPYQGGMISTLRKVARYQLESMSYCIGSRELDAQMPGRKSDCGLGSQEGNVGSPPNEQIWEISIQ